jgi:general stress protein YciG
MLQNENQTMPEQQVQKTKRGFASMNPEQQRAIASRGGRAAHQQGVAHEWNSDEAKQAGKKGGQTSGQKRKSVRIDGMPIL